MFCALLGTVAGNLALTVGARGGVYIVGGIVPKLGDMFDHSAFRARFVAKGRMQDLSRADPDLRHYATNSRPSSDWPSWCAEAKPEFGSTP